MFDDEQSADERESATADDFHFRPESPQRMNRDEVMSVLGYRKERIAKHASVSRFNRPESCNRCGKKVYQVERLDVGELYHRGCFKCYVCGIQLTLKTFHRVVMETTKEVFCAAHAPKLKKSVGQDSVGIRTAIDAQKQAGDKVFNPFEGPFFCKNDSQTKEQQRATLLKSHKDFEKFGVFKAQASLERQQQKEEDELYKQILEERSRLMRSLQEFLAKEKERTVRELIDWFEQKGSSKRDRQSGLQEVEQFYRQQLETRVKQLLEEMAVEERAAVERLIDKHAQEMLVLVQEKERTANDVLNAQTTDEMTRNDDFKYTQPPINDTKSQETGGEEEEEEGEEEEREEEEEGEEEVVYGRENDDRILVSAEDQNNEDIGAEEPGDEEKEEEEEDEESEKEEEEEEEEEGESKVTHEAFDEDDPEDEMKDSFEDVEFFGIDSGNSASANVSVVFETPADIEMNRLHLVSDKTIASSENVRKPKAHSHPKMTDEETQTYISERKRTPRRQTKDSPVKHGEGGGRGGGGGSAEHRPRVRGSPRPPRSSSNRQSSFPQFQITVSTERSHRMDDSTFHEENLPSKGKKKSNMADSSLVKTSALKPSPRERSTKRSEETREGDRDGEEDGGDDGDDDGVSSALVVPAVRPPASSKSKLYKTPEIFRDLDRRAVEEAKRDPSSFTDLVRRLSRKCDTDLQKVRAIFRWITAKDLNRMKFSETEISDSPMGLLRGIKYGTESYHNLFKRLCSYAGLHCKVIDGYSKGAGYNPGSKFGKHRFRNQWTAAWVDGSWRFVNCNWGARHVKRTDDRMTYHIDEFYFLTDPDEHIYQHFPDDERWQLLERPITLEEFVQLPVVKSPFFNGGLKFVSKVKSIWKTHTGKVEVRLAVPRILNFAAKLKPKDAGVSHGSLEECCLIRTINNQAVFLVDLPSPGRFYFEVFVESDWSSEAMDNACSFLVYCSQVSDHRLYPQVGCFGKLPICGRYRISEGSYYDPLIVSSGQLTVTFKVPKQELRLSHTLQFWKPQGKALVDFNRYAFLRNRLDSTAAFLIHCPQKGLYVLSACLVDPAVRKAKPVVFYRYLIDCVDEWKQAHILPRSSSKWHGCQLVEPVSGNLVSNTKVLFKVESKNASEILASVGGRWLPLEKTVEAMWQATVPTGEKPGKLCLYGRFASSDGKYIPLWEFAVKERTVGEEVHSLLKYL